MKIVHEDQNVMIIKDRNIFSFVIGIIFLGVCLWIILRTMEKSWIGAIISFVGFLLIALFAKMTTIIIDKNAKKLVVRWRTLVRGKSEEYDLSQVKQIELQQRYISETSTTGVSSGYSYKLAFVLNNGQEIPLAPEIALLTSGTINIGSDMARKKLVTIGTRIANFLNIPFQERRPPTVTEVLSALGRGIQNEVEKYKDTGDEKFRE